MGVKDGLTVMFFSAGIFIIGFLFMSAGNQCGRGSYGCTARVPLIIYPFVKLFGFGGFGTILTIIALVVFAFGLYSVVTGKDLFKTKEKKVKEL